MKNYVLISTLVALAACASRPDAIAPTSVSALEYQGMSCPDTKALLDQKREELASFERKQRQAATGDAVGVFFLLVPVGSVLGADNEGKVAQTKGEVNALERAIQINCRQGETTQY